MTDQIFLSYASEDVEYATRLRDELIRRGVTVWFDKSDLTIGKWKSQLRKAILKSRFFIICLSNAAIKKLGDSPGFQDEELELAYSIAQDQDPRSFTIIPVRFEECGRGDHRTAVFQHFDLFLDWDSTVDRLSTQLGGKPRGEQTKDDQATRDEALRDSLSWKSSSLYYAGRRNEALAVVDAIIAAYGSDKVSWNNKSVIFSELRRFDDALVACERSLELDPDYLIALSHYAGVLVNLGRNADALKICHKVLLREPRNAPALASSAGALVNIGKYSEAVVAANAAIAANPRFAIALANKGVALGKLGQITEALQACEQALEIDPRCVNALNSKGTCLRRLGQSEAAMQAYRAAIGADPKYWMAHRNLADLLDCIGRHREALEIYEMLHGAQPHGWSYAQVIEEVRGRVESVKVGSRDDGTESEA